MIARHALALALIAFVFFPISGTEKPLAKIETPSVEMQTATKDIARILLTVNPVDRILWTSCFLRIASIVESDDVEPHVISNTLTARAFNRATMIFLWRGIGENAPNKYPGLSEAVEKAFRENSGEEAHAISADDRKQLGALYRALAYAGQGQG